jgi:N-methylhydantoinase A
MQIATDVGGTFTDYVIYDNGEISAFKALTTKDPSEGIIKNITDIVPDSGLKNIQEFSHGTTVAVNAILERNGVPVVFFTTKGFKDLIHIGRQTRNNIYSFNCEKPQIPVDSTAEINECTTSKGIVMKSVSTDDLIEMLKQFPSANQVGVVGFINSYSNPENEIKAEQILKSHFSMVIPSYKIRREIREYERFCTAIMEGYCAPVVKKYLKKLENVSKHFYIMQSNGGKSEIEHLKTIDIIMSGPAGGVAATQLLCKKLNIEDAIAYDMGGTSADISAIVAGEPLYTGDIQINGIPIKSSAIDIESIGAGGGSIAWIDDGGALKVGPKSAGSNPGPICYDLGGTEFTVSDANLLIGILGQKVSDILLNKIKARQFASSLSQTLGIDPIELDQGVLKIVNNNMVSAVKNISIAKGYDPRNFNLVAFGGAGPMHACAIAEALGIKGIIIPPMAGAFSALGIMDAPVRYDFIRTILTSLNNAQDIIQKVVDEFINQLKEKLGDRFNEVITHISLDMRYKGQGHEINIPITDNLDKKFHDQHQLLFGFNILDNPIEVVNVKLVGELMSKKLSLPAFPKRSPKIIDKRFVYPFDIVCVYRKNFHGSVVEGPCIIEDNTTTVYVSANWKAKLDLNDILHLEGD